MPSIIIAKSCCIASSISHRNFLIVLIVGIFLFKSLLRIARSYMASILIRMIINFKTILLCSCRYTLFFIVIKSYNAAIRETLLSDTFLFIILILKECSSDGICHFIHDAISIIVISSCASVRVQYTCKEILTASFRVFILNASSGVIFYFAYMTCFIIEQLNIL